MKTNKLVKFNSLQLPEIYVEIRFLVGCVARLLVQIPQNYMNDVNHWSDLLIHSPFYLYVKDGQCWKLLQSYQVQYGTYRMDIEFEDTDFDGIFLETHTYMLTNRRGKILNITTGKKQDDF